MADRHGMVNPGIFEDLQARVDQDTTVRDELKEIIQNLEKQIRTAQSILSRAHSTPTAELPSVVTAAQDAIRHEIDSIKKLAEATAGQPYYKWNGIWTRQMQDATFNVLFCGWLGGFAEVPVNLKDRDAFHLTIEEYLHALISLVDELARLARNSVTLGDYRRPLQISQFIKDLHAGFQILNLKNDALRRRTDGMKYRVKEVEDVVYDLSLRNLVPTD